MTIRACRWPLLILLVASGGCGDGNDSTELDGSAITSMTIEASPGTVAMGTEVSFTVVASNARTVLTSARIDFEDDGTWDETRSFSETSLSTTFSHAYTTPGTFTARSEVVDANERSTTRGVQVIVTDPAVSLVTYRLRGHPSPLGQCYAEGPPATCTGCVTLLSGLGNGSGIGIGRILGYMPHGENVTVSQGFPQNGLAIEQSIRYSCTFDLTLLADVNGTPTPIGQASCSTSSQGGGQPRCSATASGTVP